MTFNVWQTTLTDQSGNAVSGANVEVRDNETGALATIYADRDGVTELSNPFSTGASGLIRFFVDSGFYQIEATKDGDTASYVWTNVGDAVAFGKLAEPTGVLQSTQVSYDDTATGLGASDVQGAIGALAAGTVEIQSTHEARSQPMQLIAHRGFRDLNVQNTLQAIAKCRQQGADAVEFDVQPSADGTFYLFHDTTVNALTNGSGTFTALSDATINGLTYTQSGGKYGAQGIPTLEDVLKYVTAEGVFCYAEMKEYRTLADVDAFVAEVESAGALDLFMFQSFESAVATRILDNNQNALAAAVLDSNLSAMQSLIDLLEPYNGRGYAIFNQNRVLAAPSIASYARERGVEIICYTVDSYNNAQELMRLGVRKIMSDYNVLGAYS